jgi:hypothetical protein
MSTFPSYPLDPVGGPRLPFTSWEDISRLFTEHLEVRRFFQLPSAKRSSTWRERRKHAPFSETVPPVWDLDALYLRHSDERAYCERLRRLKVDSSLTSVSLDLVCLDSPSVPFRWSNPHHRVEVNRSRFPGTGDLMDPSGSDICLDSAWRLRTASIEGGTGEPGRMLGEIKKEHRDARKHNFLVPYQQVEFYEQTPEARWKYYVLCPEWWREGGWTSQHMFVPIPPCVTYRASRLLSGDAAHPDSPFWWLVFESEWVVLLFGRWCSDIKQRGLMWRLPQRGRAGVQTIGTDRLLRRSSFSPTEVAQWLIDHDNHPWDKTSMSYQVRGPTRDTPAEVETINSFVRRYPAERPFMNTSIALDEDPPMPLPATDASDEEIVASGGPSNTRPLIRLASGLSCPVTIPRSAPPSTSGMSAYDAIDADPKSATVTPRGSSAELPPSLISRMQAAGQLPLMEYYARAYHQTAEGAYAPITEAVLVFAITGIREDARRARADKEAVRDELEDASNRVDDLRTRLQRSELTAAALLDSLQRSQETLPVARKHPRYE